MTHTNDTLVTVLTASLIHEIHIAKSLLNSRGITSYIFDENLMTTIGTAYVEGYKLKVNEHDLKAAKKVLSEIKSDK
ncbi:putative signal transducing protein [Lutibacter sp.]|uniref:putative signal transducing protein n=1 Tax=Lutibacter sp. TaxID=1925666 RepID=UPI002732CA39|nr:DUF2007 domain-containing protein [Lutibacter sp.]MDP3312132.1 DUF2007 domain-containing protein [Lutibacter sp.]